ncbi:GGDEF domain-containing protein [Azotobacter chroococcum]|uniref:GGDEF domain-containing protein n=1 Tax=Azotobacter chroococcum TaxID=353 RepID=UPI00103D934B|nr:GGDEF domain-containing protein [Azotobacter chroococcum]TBV96673.1 GGDEF domain-containing protein [Azotobacter chroococcum]
MKGLVLSAPRRLSLVGRRPVPADAWPLLGLALALVAVLLVGGPGAIAFPMLALLWCALRFRPFSVALLGLLSGAVEIVMVAENLAHFGPLHNSAGVDTLASARLGIAVLTLGPLSVAAVGALDRRLLRRLARRANHDSLTGALVRRALTQGVERLLERRRHCGDLPISLLMIDLDHFKTINDRHGHAAGDQVLRQLARLLGSLLRREDLFGRLGGEEFVMVLPGVRTDEAMLVAERLRQGVERMEWPEGMRVTVSVGVGALDDGTAGQPLEQRLARVDEALYQAKAQGRNRVVRAA